VCVNCEFRHLSGADGFPSRMVGATEARAQYVSSLPLTHPLFLTHCLLTQGQDSNEIHPLMWRSVIFKPSHQLFISNQAEAAKRRGTRIQRTYQSGITEEHVRRPRGVRACTVRCGHSEGTNVLLLLGNYTNNLSGTDGHRMPSHQC
jgi:hypothetical protein